MYWRLTDSVTACIAAGRVIFLDLARDRYFALPDELNEPFASWLISPNSTNLSSALRMALVELAIVSPDRADQLAPTPCHIDMPAALDAEPLAPVPITFRNLVGVAAAVSTAARDVRLKPLASTLGRRLSPSGFAAPIDGVDKLARVAAFRSVRPFIPVPRVCLHDCLALLDWFGPSRAGTQLVFGVSAFPFAAHCWVQANGRVIDDHPESVSRFEPILHFG